MVILAKSPPSVDPEPDLTDSHFRLFLYSLFSVDRGPIPAAGSECAPADSQPAHTHTHAPPLLKASALERDTKLESAKPASSSFHHRHFCTRHRSVNPATLFSLSTLYNPHACEIYRLFKFAQLFGLTSIPLCFFKMVSVLCNFPGETCVKFPLNLKFVTILYKSIEPVNFIRISRQFRHLRQMYFGN